MQCVVILGSAGAGKTEFAARLSWSTGIPVVHLDALFWGPNWRPAPREQAQAALDRVPAGDRWIVDGNFLDAGDDRFARADTVVFLDLPRSLCLSRVLWRLARQRSRPRPDLPEGCRETLDLELLRWIWRYPERDRRRVLALLARLEPRVRVHRLRTRAAVARFGPPLGKADPGEPARVCHGVGPARPNSSRPVC